MMGNQPICDTNNSLLTALNVHATAKRLRQQRQRAGDAMCQTTIEITTWILLLPVLLRHQMGWNMPVWQTILGHLCKIDQTGQYSLQGVNSRFLSKSREQVRAHAGEPGDDIIQRI